MKVNTYTPLLALLFVSGILHAQTIVPAPGVVVQGTATVEGNVKIYEPNSTTTTTTAAGTGAWEALQPTGNPKLTYVYTETDQNSQIETQINPVLSGKSTLHPDGNTGIDASTNGNMSLHRQTTDVETASYQVVVRTQKVAPAQTFTDSFGNVFNAGDVILSSTGLGEFGAPIEETVAVFATLDKTTVPGTTIVTSLVDLNSLPGVGALVGGTLTPAQLATIKAALPPTTVGEMFKLVPGAVEGGSLFVEGDATIAGKTTTNGIDNSGNKITSVADGTAATDAATVGQVAAADTALGGRIDQEITDRTNADNLLGGRIDTEIVDRTNADNLLGGRIDTEIVDRIAGDAALTIRINDEQSARMIADNALNIRIDDTNLRVTNEVNRLDGRINGVQANLANERSERIAADNSLRDGIEENTRGIAMVAAMTNTRVEAGKTHGVDFNMAQFQSETGFAFGYANRINDNVQVHGSIASTTDFDESVVRVGVAVQW